MEATMELDDLKQAWRQLGRQLETANALQLERRRERRLGRMRRSLLPLWAGQLLQMLFGLAVLVAAVAFWSRYRAEPAMLATGIALHAWAVATIASGGIMLGLLGRIDHGAPVLKIQKALARLRRFYVLSGMCVGLPWAVLWVALPVMAARAGAGIDLFAVAPGFVYGSLAFGVLLLLGVAAFHVWSRSPARPELARRMDDSLSGRSLRRAREELAEIERFESD